MWRKLSNVNNWRKKYLVVEKLFTRIFYPHFLFLCSDTIFTFVFWQQKLKIQNKVVFKKPRSLSPLLVFCLSFWLFENYVVNLMTLSIFYLFMYLFILMLATDPSHRHVAYALPLSWAPNLDSFKSIKHTCILYTQSLYFEVYNPEKWKHLSIQRIIHESSIAAALE
jgi:hypothetical protein